MRISSSNRDSESRTWSKTLIGEDVESETRFASATKLSGVILNALMTVDISTRRTAKIWHYHSNCTSKHTLFLWS
jgi:hypothetical protein